MIPLELDRGAHFFKVNILDNCGDDIVDPEEQGDGIAPIGATCVDLGLHEDAAPFT